MIFCAISKKKMRKIWCEYYNVILSQKDNTHQFHIVHLLCLLMYWGPMESMSKVIYTICTGQSLGDHQEINGD